MVSVIIPSYKNPLYLDLCLMSALDNQESKNEIIVVIDGFPDLSLHIVDKYKNMVIFEEFDENQGMQMSINYGVWKAKNNIILVAAEDNVFPYHWDSNIKSVFSDDMVLSCNQIEPCESIFANFVHKDFGKTTSEFSYMQFIDFEKTLKSSKITDDGGTFPFVLSKKSFMSVGGFDTIYSSPHVCDWDFFLKLEMIGLKFARSYNSTFYHFGGKSTKHRDFMYENFNDKEKEAADLFNMKWGFYPYRNSSTNSYIPTENINGIIFKK